MPWCTSCDRFLSPSTVSVDGTCPECGRAVDPGRAHAAAAEELATPLTDLATAAALEDEDERPPLPWHLWLLLAALSVYLGYRAFQGIELLFGM